VSAELAAGRLRQRPRPRRRIMSYCCQERRSQVVAAAVAPVANLATITAIIGALMLFALHRLNILDVPHFLRGS